MAAGGHFEWLIFGDLYYKSLQNVGFDVLGVKKLKSEVILDELTWSWPDCHKKHYKIAGGGHFEWLIFGE